MASRRGPRQARGPRRRFILALSSFGIENADRRLQQLIGRVDAFAVQGPAPAEIIRQVARRHAIETSQPLPEAPVIAVDVLHVDGAAHPFALAQVDRFMGDAGLAGEGKCARCCLLKCGNCADQRLKAAVFIKAPFGLDTCQTIRILGSSVDSTHNGDSARQNGPQGLHPVTRSSHDAACAAPDTNQRLSSDACLLASIADACW